MNKPQLSGDAGIIFLLVLAYLILAFAPLTLLVAAALS